MTMPIRNQERFDRLKGLAPLEAVRAWLDGAFGIGDEPAMMAAIRKDARISPSLTENDIVDAICDAMDSDLDPAACLDRLVSLK